MKNKLLAVAGILLFSAQALPSFAAEAAGNYAKMCVSCHGKDRKGAPAMAKAFKVDPAKMDLTRQTQKSSDADLVKTITDGKGKMPAHKAKLTVEEIAALVAYLKAPAASAAAATPPDAKAPAAQPAAKAADNADFKAKCASCHAKDGKGNPAMAKMFKVDPAALDLTKKAAQEKTDEALAKLITDGKGKMPSFKGKLSDIQVTELVKYLRTLVPQAKP